LHEKVKNELHENENDVQYGDQFSNAPLQQNALQLEAFHWLHVDGFLWLHVDGFLWLHVDGFLDGEKQNP
jgi:hypothetical protein